MTDDGATEKSFPSYLFVQEIDMNHMSRRPLRMVASGIAMAAATYLLIERMTQDASDNQPGVADAPTTVPLKMPAESLTFGAASGNISGASTNPSPIASINELRFQAARDRRPALTAESRLLHDGKIDAVAAQSLFDHRQFDRLIDDVDKEMHTDEFSTEIASMFEGALSESFAPAGFDLDRLACGRMLCVGSATARGEQSSWNAATAQFERTFGETYSAIMSSYRYVDGQLIQHFILSTNPAEPGVHFARMPSAGIQFGPAPDAPPPPTSHEDS